MIFPGFPGVLSFFQVFQVEWEPCIMDTQKNELCPPFSFEYAYTKSTFHATANRPNDQISFENIANDRWPHYEEAYAVKDKWSRYSEKVRWNLC